jgi:hypothetical protein
MENIWGRMTSIMYKNEFRPNTVEQLQQRIVDTWHEISPEGQYQIAAVVKS